MTSSSFSRPGAVDLSALKSQAQTDPANAAGGARRFVMEVTSIDEFQAVLGKSMQFPVVVELFSARTGPGLSTDLIALTEEAGGRFLLVRVDCDARPEIAQALGVQALPTVLAVLGGQLAPLFQGVQPKANIKAVLDQVLQAAAANGIMGKAEPVAGQPATGETDEVRGGDPRYDPAYEAMERGDFARAREEFDAVLKATPNDAEALAGRAQAGLLARSGQLDGSELTRAAAEPDNVDVQFAAADFELAQGDAEAAYGRLVDLIRRTGGEDRERVRVRLLELFETREATDPIVLKFRRKLAGALF